MLRGKLNSAALQSATLTLNSSIESVRRLAALTPSSERESEPTSRMLSRPSAPAGQPERSGGVGQCLAAGAPPGGEVGVSIATALGATVAAPAGTTVGVVVEVAV